jgi:hypothetical protein
MARESEILHRSNMATENARSDQAWRHQAWSMTWRVAHPVEMLFARPRACRQKRTAGKWPSFVNRTSAPEQEWAWCIACKVALRLEPYAARCCLDLTGWHTRLQYRGDMNRFKNADSHLDMATEAAPLLALDCAFALGKFGICSPMTGKVKLVSGGSSLADNPYGLNELAKIAQLTRLK